MKLKFADKGMVLGCGHLKSQPYFDLINLFIK